jgi:GntR family transcriptional repressor for pyruvate dehydrogenase complex
MGMKHESPNGAVVRQLLAHIQAAGLRVGDRLPSIRELAAQLKVGTNVVRYGMVQAEAMGLVRIHPRSGAFVQSLDFAPLVNALENTLTAALAQKDHNLFHLIDVRELLEVEAVGQAARRRRLEDLLPVRRILQAMEEAPDRTRYVEADIRFHLAIAEVAGNPVLLTMLRALLGFLRPCFLSVLLRGKSKAKSEASHERIYQALLAGAADAAQAAMREHLGLARKILLSEVGDVAAKSS